MHSLRWPVRTAKWLQLHELRAPGCASWTHTGGSLDGLPSGLVAAIRDIDDRGFSSCRPRERCSPRSQWLLARTWTQPLVQLSFRQGWRCLRTCWCYSVRALELLRCEQRDRPLHETSSSCGCRGHESCQRCRRACQHRQWTRILQSPGRKKWLRRALHSLRWAVRTAKRLQLHELCASGCASRADACGSLDCLSRIRGPANSYYRSCNRACMGEFWCSGPYGLLARRIPLGLVQSAYGRGRRLVHPQRRCRALGPLELLRRDSCERPLHQGGRCCCRCDDQRRRSGDPRRRRPRVLQQAGRPRRLRCALHPLRRPVRPPKRLQLRQLRATRQGRGTHTGGSLDCLPRLVGGACLTCKPPACVLEASCGSPYGLLPRGPSCPPLLTADPPQIQQSF